MGLSSTLAKDFSLESISAVSLSLSLICSTPILMSSAFAARAAELEASILDLVRDSSREISPSTSGAALRSVAWCAEVTVDDPIDIDGQHCVDHAFSRVFVELIRESQSQNVFPMRWVSRGAALSDEAFESDVEGASASSSVARALDIALTSAESSGIASSALFMGYEIIIEACTVRGARDALIWLEARKARAREDSVWKYGKLTILRTMVALTKRCTGRGMLEAEVHGRALFLLHWLNGVNDRAGMNLSGMVNTQTTEIFEQEAWIREGEEFLPDDPATDDKMAKMEIDNVDSDDERGGNDNDGDDSWIDDTFHAKFWSIQEFFQNPPATMSRDGGWNRFYEILTLVLSAFEAHPLGDTALEILLEPMSELALKVGFRFLTARRLLPLQMKDYRFRRQILIQAAFFLHFCGDEKYAERQKERKQELKVVDEEVTEASERVMKILQRTGPNATFMAEFIEVALVDETQWLDWKMQGCPDFVREPIKDLATWPMPEGYDVSKSQWPPDMYPPDDPTLKYDLGNATLNKIWNASKDDSSIVDLSLLKTPTLQEFFAQCLEEMDPEAQIEPEYRLVNDKTFQWKAMRMLSENHMHLFAKIASEGLESVIAEVLGVPDPRPQKQVSEEDAKKAAEEASRVSEGQVDILNTHVEELDGAIESIEGDQDDTLELRFRTAAEGTVEDMEEEEAKAVEDEIENEAVYTKPNKHALKRTSDANATIETPAKTKNEPAIPTKTTPPAAIPMKSTPPAAIPAKSTPPAGDMKKVPLAPPPRLWQEQQPQQQQQRNVGVRGSVRSVRDYQDRDDRNDRGGGRIIRGRDDRPMAPVPQPPLPMPQQHQPPAYQRYDDRRGGGRPLPPRHDDRAPPPPSRQQPMNRPPPPPAGRPDTNLGKRRRDGDGADQYLSPPDGGGHEPQRARGNQGQRFNRNRTNTRR